MTILVNILSAIVDVALFDSVYCCILGRRPKARLWFFGYAAIMAAVIVGLNLLDLHFNIVFIVSMLTVLAYSCILFSGPALAKLFSTFLIAFIVLSGDQLGAAVILFANSCMGNQAPVVSENLILLASAVIYAWFILLAAVFHLLPLRTGVVRRKKRIVLFFIPLVAGAIAFITNTVWNSIPNAPWPAYFLPFLMFMLLIVFTLLFCRYAERIERGEQEAAALNSQLELYNETYGTMIHDVSSARAFRHDISHHLQMIRNLLAEDKFQEGITYIDTLQPYVGVARGDQLTANSLVDTLVRQKQVSAERYGIRFTANIDVKEKLGLPYPDACVILANALENAIEACQLVEKVNERFIDVRIFTRKPCLFIFIKNSMAKPPIQKGGELVSTKENRYEHGFGLKNIQAIVSKHGGTVLPEWEGSVYTFNCSVILPAEIWEGKAL